MELKLDYVSFTPSTLFFSLSLSRWLKAFHVLDVLFRAGKNVPFEIHMGSDVFFFSSPILTLGVIETAGVLSSRLIMIFFWVLCLPAADALSSFSASCSMCL